MTVSKLLTMCLFCCISSSVFAQTDASRGALLYQTHCILCHDTEVHWRSRRLATDWNGLLKQVKRWQASSNLNWSDDEIGDVARYLNALYYGYPEPQRKGYSRNDKTTPQ